MSLRTRVTLAAATIAIGLLISGCSGASPELDTQTSQNWRTRVVAIAEYAGAGDHATALQELATLETEVAEDRKNGEISAERAAIIQQSIDLVRADLETTSEPVTPEPKDTAVPITDEPEPAPDEDENSNDDNDNENGNKTDKKNENNGNKNKDDNGNDD